MPKKLNVKSSNTSKRIVRVRPPVVKQSVIITATPDEITAYGSPAYYIDDSDGHAFGTMPHMPLLPETPVIVTRPDLPLSERYGHALAVPAFNRTLAVTISGEPSAVLYADMPNPEPLPFVEPELADNPAPELTSDANDSSVSDLPEQPAGIDTGFGFTLIPESEQPEQASQPAADSPVIDLTERMLARRAAKLAVREFYAGASLPFKAAADLRYRAAINFARFAPGSVTGTERTAAALAAVLAYCDVQPDGTFIRGSGRVPRRLLGIDESGELAAGLESGVLSRLIGTGAIAYVSGATSGIGAELAVYRLVKPAAKRNMLAHNEKTSSGEHRFSRVLALLDSTVLQA